MIYDQQPHCDTKQTSLKIGRPTCFQPENIACNPRLLYTITTLPAVVAIHAQIFRSVVKCILREKTTDLAQIATRMLTHRMRL